MTLLEVSGLNLAIGGAPVLEDVSFGIPSGEIMGIVGESGSGKTMTSLAVMGLLPPGAAADGRVRLGGHDLLGASEAEMCAIRGREVGMIFQEPMTALNPLKTIGDQVAETLLVHGRADRRRALGAARERLDRVGLREPDFPLDRYPHELSGGQRQRVCIALAIALRPKLLIADEPTTALDVSTQAQILELLSSLVADDGMSLMLITHDLAVVAGLADHVAVMQDGRIVEANETRTLFTGMRHPYTRRLLAASSHRPARRERAESAPLLTVENAVRDYPLPRTGLFRKPGLRRAVDRVSFSLRRRESLGLVGESGCGKSTLTRAILGLEPLQGGAITLDGKPVLGGTAVPVSLRRNMQVVFQDPYGSFNPRHRVARLVSEPFFLNDRPLSAAEVESRVAGALEDVGLHPDDMHKYIHEFSGGQRQRIAIARALVVRPRLIVLDEAVSSLDVSIRAQILDLLAELQERHGLSYLFISHDLTVITAITDRVMVMKDGRIVESGATEAVFHAPAHPYTRHLIDSAPTIPPDWQQEETHVRPL